MSTIVPDAVDTVNDMAMTLTPDPADDVLERLSALMFLFRAEMHRAARDTGLPAGPLEARMLLKIGQHPGCTAAELARHSGRDKAQLARLLQQMEQAGLLQRSPDADDRRLQRLALSAEGEQLLARLKRQRKAVVKRLLARLQPGEQAQLAALLARLLPEPEVVA
jgi:DNA-binding MarR family transcriptional regulator